MLDAACLSYSYSLLFCIWCCERQPICALTSSSHASRKQVPCFDLHSTVTQNKEEVKSKTSALPSISTKHDNAKFVCTSEQTSLAPLPTHPPPAGTPLQTEVRKEKAMTWGQQQCLELCLAAAPCWLHLHQPAPGLV